MRQLRYLRRRARSCLRDSHLGEALRALLVLEVRGARVITTAAPEKAPAYLPAGCEALRCALRTPSGGRVSVLLGGPPEGGPSTSHVCSDMWHWIVNSKETVRWQLHDAWKLAALRSNSLGASDCPRVGPNTDSLPSDGHVRKPASLRASMLFDAPWSASVGARAPMTWRADMAAPLVPPFALFAM